MMEDRHFVRVCACWISGIIVVVGTIVGGITYASISEDEVRTKIATSCMEHGGFWNTKTVRTGGSEIFVYVCQTKENADK